jgi:cytochrome P450
MSVMPDPLLDPLSLLRPEAYENPYPIYDRLRSGDPIHWNAIFDAWLVTRYADVSVALRDPRFSTKPRILEVMDRLAEDKQEELAPLRRFVSTWMLVQDPPEHTRLRARLLKAFTLAAQEAMRPRIQAIVDALIDAVLKSGQMEVICDLAQPLPLVVIAELVGIPPADAYRFVQWSGALAAFIGGGSEALSALESLRAMRAYFKGIAEERRERPGLDLISGLVAPSEGEALSEEEQLAVCALFFIAGNETTPNLIGNGLLTLLTHPAELARLLRDPALFPSAIDELLRYESPVQFVPRVAKADVVLDGRVIRAGQCALLMMGAANRDPAQFADPAKLDLGRQQSRHVAFGSGVHACLGAALARIEGRIAIETVLRRMPKLTLRDETPRWHVERPGSNMRGLSALNVAF